jgi:ABC-type branched-subunit amino acid transport system substrate-binding protein
VGPIVTADAAAAAAQALGVTIVTLTQREGVSDRGEFVFRNFITPRMQTEALVTHAVAVMGARRFAILYPQDNYGKTFMNLFWDEIIHQGGTVAAAAPYDGEQTDFAEAIKKTIGLSPVAELPEALERDPSSDRLPFADIAGDLVGLYHPLPPAFYPPAPDPLADKVPSLLWATAPAPDGVEPEAIVDFDVVFIPDAPRTAGLIIPQLAYYDVSRPVLMGTNLWHSEDLVAMSRDYVQGAVFPDGFFTGSRQPGVRRFVSAYESIYGEPPGFVEAVSYDSARLLMEIITRTTVRSRTDVRDALRQTADFQGATGVTAFDYNGEARKKPFLLTIRGSRFEEITPPLADPPMDAGADPSVVVPGPPLQ